MRIAPWALLVLVLVVGVVFSVAEQSEDAKRERAMHAQMAQERGRWQDSLARVITQYRRDTVRVTRYAKSYYAIRDTLRLTDTVRVKEALVAADSAIKACSDVVLSCSRRAAYQDSIIASQQVELEWWVKRSKPKCGRKCAFYLGVGAAVVGAVALEQVQGALSRGQH